MGQLSPICPRDRRPWARSAGDCPRHPGNWPKDVGSRNEGPRRAAASRPEKTFGPANRAEPQAGKGPAANGPDEPIAEAEQSVVGRNDFRRLAPRAAAGDQRADAAVERTARKESARPGRAAAGQDGQGSGRAVGDFVESAGARAHAARQTTARIGTGPLPHSLAAGRFAQADALGGGKARLRGT